MALKHGKIALPRPKFTPVFFHRLLWGVGIIVASLLLILLGAGFFLTYRIATTRNDIENVSPSTFLLPSFQSVGFRDSSGAEHDGWLLLGLKGAPVIVMCPGYDSNRSELLYLGVVLQANHFNVYLFNFDSPKSSAKFSDLGVHQASVVRSAIDMIMKRPEINPHRVGVYGTTLGAYAALVAAEHDPRITALAMDNVYSTPVELFDAQMDRLLGGTGSAFRSISSAEFRLFTMGTKAPPVQADLAKLKGCSKLFIAGEDVPLLSASTKSLYKAAPEPKRLLIVGQTETDLNSDSERKEYQNQVLNFFLQALALRVD